MSEEQWEGKWAEWFNRRTDWYDRELQSAKLGLVKIMAKAKLAVDLYYDTVPHKDRLNWDLLEAAIGDLDAALVKED